MATHLNLEEQEQVAQFKHLWNSYGTWLMAVVLVALAAYGGWMGYRSYQGNQSAKAAVLNEQIQTAIQGKDWTAVQRGLGDVQQYSGTDYAQQASLEAAKAYHDNGKADDARKALEWVVNSGSNAGYQAVARLRLASVALEAKDFDGAIKQLSGDMPAAFKPLADDKRGDVLMAQGQRDAARSAYEQAYKALPASDSYRNMIEVKLNALGVDVSSLAAQAS